MSGRGPLLRLHGIDQDRRYDLRRSARNASLTGGNAGSKASDQDSSKNESEEKRRESKKRPQQTFSDEEVQEVTKATARQKKKSRGTGKEKKGAEPRDSTQRLAIQPRDEPEDAVPLERGSDKTAGTGQVQVQGRRSQQKGKSKWDQRFKAFEDWAGEAQEEDENRRSKAAGMRSKARKKQGIKSFSAKEWAVHSKYE